jgi:hypothetical protein
MSYTGHKFYQFETTSGMERSSEKEIHSFDHRKAKAKRLTCIHPGNMPGTTIPVSVAAVAAATEPRNNFISPNPPDVMRMTKGCKIVGIV